MECWSMVGLCLSEEAIKALRVQEQNGITEALFSFADRCEMNERNGSIMWLWNSIMWNDVDISIGTLLDFLNHQEDDKYLLITTNERTGECETKGSYKNNLFGMFYTVISNHVSHVMTTYKKQLAEMQCEYAMNQLHQS